MGWLGGDIGASGGGVTSQRSFYAVPATQKKLSRSPATLVEFDDYIYTDFERSFVAAHSSYQHFLLP